MRSAGKVWRATSASACPAVGRDSALRPSVAPATTSQCGRGLYATAVRIAMQRSVSLTIHVKKYIFSLQRSAGKGASTATATNPGSACKKRFFIILFMGN